MISISLFSDLHIESNQRSNMYSLSSDADIIILAGDIHTESEGIDWARSNFKKDQKIIYVAGNHEFYHCEYFSLLKEFREKAKELDIVFLENNEVIIDGIRIMGCTLWTDYLSNVEINQEEAMHYAADALADHYIIRIQHEKEEPRIFSTQDALAIHRESVAWLKGKLEQKFDGKTIVVTHHGPSLACVHKDFGNNNISPVFLSNLNYLVRKADFWFYGHTHSNLNVIENSCRIVSNQKGYREESWIEFDENILIEI